MWASLFCLISATGLLINSVAYSAVYRCGEGDSLTFSDIPCGTDARLHSPPPVSKVPGRIPNVNGGSTESEQDSEYSWDPKKHGGETWEAHQETVRSKKEMQCLMDRYNTWFASQRPRPSRELADSKMQVFQKECTQLYSSTKKAESARPAGKYDVIDAAVRKGDLAAVTTYLNGGGDPNLVLTFPGPIRKVISAPLLLLAVNHGQDAIGRMLVKYGARVDAGNQDGYTALHSVAQNGLVEFMEYLLSTGMDISVRTVQGYTPLHTATHGMSLQSVKFLIAKGAPINAMDKRYGTPLQTAVIHNKNDDRLEIVQALLVAGGDPNLPGSTGEYPLHFAVRNRQYQPTGKIIAALIAHGANVEARNRKGETPRDIAKGLGLQDVVGMLDAGGRNTTDAN